MKTSTANTSQICQTVGWGGNPIRIAADADISDRLKPVTTAQRIRVTFNSNVSDSLPWKFTPQQREVSVLPGETALAFYTATNTTDQDIIGVATYSVTPGQVAPYFSKIQCFCFEEQRLAAGETVDMPVFFYIDPDVLEDFNMRNVKTVTLNYTFFSKFWAPGVFVVVCVGGVEVANCAQRRDMTTTESSGRPLRRPRRCLFLRRRRRSCGWMAGVGGVYRRNCTFRTSDYSSFLEPYTGGGL